MRRRPLPALAGLILLCLLAPGCAGIAPGEDPVLVNAERTVAASFEAANGFLTIEKQNQAAVKRDLPAVHLAAERLRKDGPQLFREARVITKAYKASPDPDTTDALNAKLNAVKAWSAYAAWALRQIRGGL